nr:hypothetical protein [Tanacetum cinerariifolium]
MQGMDLSMQERHSRLMNEFDKFFVEAEEALQSVAKRAARNHNPLALVANSYAIPSSSHYSQQHYVTHPPSVLDHDDDYLGEILAAELKDTLSTAMMLQAYAISQHFLNPTNNRLCTYFNIKNQAYVQYGIVDIQGKSLRYVGGNRRNAENQGRNVMNQGITARNDIAAKDEAGVHLDAEENDSMLMSANGVEMMAHLQPGDHDSDAKLTYDTDFASEETELKKEFIKEVQDMLDVFELMEGEVVEMKNKMKNNSLENNFDRLLEASLAAEIKNYVLSSAEQIENQRRNEEVFINSAAPTLSNNQDKPSTSSIIVDNIKAPQIVSSFKEPMSPIANDVPDEFIQEDFANLEGNTFINLFGTHVTDEAQSSTTNMDPSNMHEFH